MRQFPEKDNVTLLSMLSISRSCGITAQFGQKCEWLSSSCFTWFAAFENPLVNNWNTRHVHCNWSVSFYKRNILWVVVWFLWSVSFYKRNVLWVVVWFLYLSLAACHSFVLFSVVIVVRLFCPMSFHLTESRSGVGCCHWWDRVLRCRFFILELSSSPGL